MLIEIFSDVVCPWCFIGKRRLDMVMNSSVGEGVELIWGQGSFIHKGIL